MWRIQVCHKGGVHRESAGYVQGFEFRVRDTMKPLKTHIALMA